MAKKAEDLYREALALSDSEREALIRLLTARSNEVAGDAEIADAWLDEAQRRVVRYDAGASQARDADEVLSDIERQLK